MTQGSGDARKQPLWFFLTTAGTDRNSICWEVHQKAVDIIEGWPGARLERVPGAGHMVQLEQPKLVGETIETLVRENWPV